MSSRQALHQLIDDLPDDRLSSVAFTLAYERAEWESIQKLKREFMDNLLQQPPSDAADPSLESTAHHEAGHAVAAFALRRAVREVSIEPDGEQKTLGHVLHTARGEQFRPDIEVDARTRRLIEQDIMTALAGGIAEAHYAGAYNRAVEIGSERDYKAALGLALYVAGDDEGASRYLHWLHHRIEGLLGQRHWWTAVQTLAVELLQRQRLSGHQTRTAIRRGIQTSFEAASAANASSRKSRGLPPLSEVVQTAPESL